jgi:hypothetical protein
MIRSPYLAIDYAVLSLSVVLVVGSAHSLYHILREYRL